MNIIIDNKDGKFNGEVDNNEAKITSNPKTVLSTSDLLSCVGLAVIERTGENEIKRGLAHIHYKPDILSRAADDKDAYTMVPKLDEVRGVREGLDKLISNFQDPRAILIFNSFKKNKIGNLENPMANYVFYHLIDKKVIFHFPGNFIDNHLSGKIKSDVKRRIYDWDEDYAKTYYKNVGLSESKLIVQHMARPRKDKNGNLLKHGTSIEIKKFPIYLNF